MSRKTKQERTNRPDIAEATGRSHDILIARRQAIDTGQLLTSRSSLALTLLKK
ncbi:MAG: hypothetical protein MK110_13935 [Fuerstiella sp.]|nr:hypothetical protein [Fuerstiella sp.]